MKKLLSLIIIAMFALTMSSGTFASDDKSTTKSTSSTEKPKKSKKSKKSTSSSTKSSSEKAPAAAPSK